MNMKKQYDIIIIGGGAIGCGIALEASINGYRVLLLEKNDFGSGASSKSTKLVHGGVRYLEKAILNIDFSWLRLVKEALKERTYFLSNSPCAKKLKIKTSSNNLFQTIYLYLGLKIYDLLSFKNLLCSTKILDAKNVQYCDGSFNDLEMITTLIQNAKKYGLEVKNYTEVGSFIFEEEKIIGVNTENIISYEINSFYASKVINATGEYIDKIRKLSDKESKELIVKSKGSHIVIPKKFYDSDVALLIPKTEDNRVIFIHPYLDEVLVGTTEINEISNSISNEEIDYLLKYFNEYTNNEAKKEDIISSFSGVRSLIKSEDENLSNVIREHIIEINKQGLISVAGGKWTTYRKIANDVMKNIYDKDIKSTKNLELEKIDKITLNEIDIKKAIEIYDAKRVIDILFRLTFLVIKNKNEAIENIDKVAINMADVLSWDLNRIEEEKQYAKDYINKYFK